MECCDSGIDEQESFGGVAGGWNMSESGSCPGSPASITECRMKVKPLPSMMEDESDAYIAEALQGMSLEQRNELYHELHAVVDTIEESPEFLRTSFEKLRHELDAQVNKKTVMGGLNVRPFWTAQSQDTNYVHSEFLYKAFLRAERFDVKKAALRMIRFYDMKQTSFGAAHLAKDVTQDDLSAEDLKIYRKGFSQTLPCRDVMGRSIAVMFPNLAQGYITPDRMGRLYIYQTMSMIQDEETQKKGCSVVVMAGGGDTLDGETKRDSEAPMMDLKFVPTAARSLMALPIRYACVHNCFEDSRWKLIMKLGLSIVSPEIRARNKVHFGAPMECIYELMGFGIPPHALPVDMRGTIKTKQHQEFIKMRKNQEILIAKGFLKPISQFSELDSNKESYEIFKHSPFSVIVVPTNEDVLLGRGKPIHSHPGNARLHGLVDELIPYYESCRKLEKTRISVDLVDKVKYEIGGRFLKQDHASSSGGSVWVVVDDDTARAKVSHLFRARRDSVLEAVEKQREKEEWRSTAAREMERSRPETVRSSSRRVNATGDDGAGDKEGRPVGKRARYHNKESL